MILVDYYSNFFEIDEINSMSSGTIIKIMQRHFSRYGIPEILISDSGS